MPTLAYTGTLTVQSCINCGTMFGVEQNLDYELRRTHREFFCPNGHRQFYNGETEAERLKRELQQQKDRTAQEQHRREQAEARILDERREHDHTVRRLRGTKSVVTRMKRRIVVGSCVCCSRKFKDLERHMKVSHPDWSPDKAAEAMAAKS